MQLMKERWKEIVERVLTQYKEEVVGQEVQLPPLALQKPPKAELGDIAFPLFAYAKLFKNSPQNLSVTLKERLLKEDDLPGGEIITAGPYLNIKIDTNELCYSLVKEVERLKEDFGRTNLYKKSRVMIEFSCPNTNKPLHLGHLRNDAIGESISAILEANGAEVYKVNLINNRGVHICKSMLAYQKFGNNETPESAQIKGDHLVGNYYVKFSEWEKEEPQATTLAQQMLKQWEEGDEEILHLWNLMNKWTLDGIGETYKKTDVSFDHYYYESDTYSLGKDEVLKGVEKGVFYKEEDGSVWIDLEEINLDKKVLLRKDGTSLYLTQDIGTAILRHEDWPFNTLIYVVANEQTYHFKVLFHVLQKLGYQWAHNLHHLAYGMVNLPEGKMKSREGTVVDADDLIDDLTALAKEEILSKEREEAVGDLDETSRKIALGALNYFLLQVNPMKDMVFNPTESISFNGNTGPYLQYMGARISSMVRRFELVADEYEGVAFDPTLLSLEEERQLIIMVASYSEVVELAGKELNPSHITAYLYELSRLFSKYYHDHPILKAPSAPLVKSRFTLVSLVLQVFRNAYALLKIPFLESM